MHLAIKLVTIMAAKTTQPPLPFNKLAHTHIITFIVVSF